MGKWGVDAQEDSVSIVDCDDKEWLLEMRGSTGFDIKTARQICLMHNEGIELLRKIAGYSVITDCSFKLLTWQEKEAQDLLKRMGVDCE